MKLTITTPLGPNSVPITIKEILERLNRLVVPKDSPSPEFFKQGKAGAYISIGSCSNSNIHNKLIMLLGLWFDSNYNKLRTYTAIGEHDAGMKFYYTDSMLEEFNAFINSIGSYENLKNMTINFELK